MPDIVLGALIGVFATALGSIITGIINYKQSTSQQRFNAQQAHIDRLVKTRGNVLIPLREVMSKRMKLVNDSLAMTVRVQEASKEGQSSRAISETQLMMQVWEEAKQVETELDILRGQISDITLDESIENAKNAHFEAGTDIIGFVRLVQHSQNIGIDSLESETKKFDSIQKSLRDKLLVVNKRIEELLTGEPST